MTARWWSSSTQQQTKETAMRTITLCDTRGPLNQLNDALAGSDGAMWLDALKRMLRKENPWVPIGKVITTVTIGVHKTYDTYRALLGANVNKWTEDILKKTTLSQTPTDIDLIEVSGTELGFDKAARFDVICKRIVERGFDLCPAEAGPALRLAYKDQPNGELLIVAMEALTDSDGCPFVFCVAHDGDGLRLGTVYGSPGYLFYPAGRFVVARRK